MWHRPAGLGCAVQRVLATTLQVGHGVEASSGLIQRLDAAASLHRSPRPGLLQFVSEDPEEDAVLPGVAAPVGLPARALSEEAGVGKCA